MGAEDHSPGTSPGSVSSQCKYPLDPQSLDCAQSVLSKRCSFCLLSLPWPCFPQLCPVHGFCRRKAALCNVLLPVCHLIPWCSSSPLLPWPHLFQGLNLSAVGVWKSFLRSCPGIISTNRERAFLWYRNVSILRESPFLRMLRLAAPTEQIALRKVGGDQILAPS